MSKSDSIQRNFENIKIIHDNFLDFLEDEEGIEEKFENLTQIFEDTEIRSHKHELRLFLHMLVEVSNNHYRVPNFFSKIERILELFKDEIKKYQNTEILSIFKSNKRILLYLIEEQIITVDKYFIKQITTSKYIQKKYPQYFAPEIQQFVKEKWFPKYDRNDKDLQNNYWVEEINKKLPEHFYDLRKRGENDSYLCKLIREDKAEEFITFLYKSNINHNSTITPSIYETNPFLIKKQEQNQSDGDGKKGITLIEYAAFFGSIQIFSFLNNEGVELAPSLWNAVIHGKNADLIHLLENKHVKPTTTIIINDQKFEGKSYKGCFKESIKCHHNDIANYFLSNFLQNKYENSNDAIIQSLKYYNFSYLQYEQMNECLFCHLCHFDYYSITDSLLTSTNVDINSIVIQNHIFNKI